MAVDLHDPAVRRHFYIQMAKKRVRPGSGSGPETLWARTWRLPVFDLRTITAVPFVVIGGVATRLYAPERMTDDLVLMKMRASRGIDIGDLTRVLGAADDAAIAEAARVIAIHLPEGAEDLEGLIYLGRLEYGQAHESL